MACSHQKGRNLLWKRGKQRAERKGAKRSVKPPPTGENGLREKERPGEGCSAWKIKIQRRETTGDSRGRKGHGEGYQSQGFQMKWNSVLTETFLCFTK